MTYTEQFLELVKNNPELPIAPIVDGEVVGDDGCSWLGRFGSSCVGEYTKYINKYCDCRYFDDRDDFKEYYYSYNIDELCERFNYDPRICEYALQYGKCTLEQLEENNKNKKLLDEYLDKVADECFKKAIIVYIGLHEN